jgi:hypothetical protein
MAFRGDIEAERARVAALEEEVAVARRRRDLDQARIAELHRLTTERQTRLPTPPRPPLSRGRKIGSGIAMGFFVFLGIVSAFAPRHADNKTWLLSPMISVKNELAASTQISVIEADEMLPTGEARIEYGRKLRVRTPSPPEIIEWEEFNGELRVRRYPFTGENARAGAIHCTPAQVARRGAIREWARVRYHDGSWTVGTTTFADDCEGSWWGHE